MFLKKDLSETAHADSADSDKVNVYWFLKINFIHIMDTCLFFVDH